MTTEQTALTLPDEATFRRDITALNRFQQVVHSTMIQGQDYGIIPGTNKPTLLKPGAEKIAKLLGLADQYEIMDKSEDWDRPFFRYLIKCRLVHVASGAVISEGLGECNSFESKYRFRWVSERDLPAGTDTAKLVSQERHSRTGGGHWTVYRLDNEDIFSQVNTILKMSKKRALVDAALSAGRLSDVFTQDIEDMNLQPEFTTETTADRSRKEQPKSEPPKKELTNSQKLSAAVKESGYTNDEVKAHMMAKYGVEATKDLTPEQWKELILDVVNCQVPKAKPQEELFPEDAG